MANTPQKMLSIRDLFVDYETADGIFPAIRGVCATVNRGEILGLVSESGCGKSTLGRSLLRLNDERSTRYRGEIVVNNTDVLAASTKDLPHLRGSEIAMIFQDPLRSLNPVFTIGRQLTNAIKLRGETDAARIHSEAIMLLHKVGLTDAKQRLRQYPHQLSGGQRQRVVIAMALAQNPKVLVADEPTTALDVTTQQQILRLLKRLCDEFGMSMVFITHDLAVIWQLCDRVAVMYYGIIVEQGTVHEVFDDPRHPYTQGLLASVPSMVTAKSHPLATIMPRHEVQALDIPWDDASIPFTEFTPGHFAREVASGVVAIRGGSE